MATAPDKVDQEGKRMATSSHVCGACEIKLSVKFCKECPIYLCDTCARGHRNIKYTKDHVLSDVDDTVIDGNTILAASGTCAKHDKEKVTDLCKECIELICNMCKPDHSGHAQQSLNDDPKLYQRVCGKHIQKLIDDLHEVEEMKSCLESHINTYDEAIVRVDMWELDLMQKVKTKAAKLRKQLTELKADKFKQLTDKVNGLLAKVQHIDNTIAQLTAIRKSMDLKVLGEELTRSQELIDRLESFKTEMAPMPAPNVDDILTNGDLIKNAEDDLDLIFTAHSFKTKGPQPVAAWQFNRKNNGKDISTYAENPVIMQNLTYALGPRGENDGAVVFPTDSKTQKMTVMNPSGRLRFSTTMTYVAHIFIEDSVTGPLFTYYDNIWGSRLLVYPTKSSLGIFDTSTDYVIADNVLTTNTWQKLVVVWDVSKISIYVDGKISHEQACSVNLSKTNTGDIYFSVTKSKPNHILGRIASAKFYDVALSESEVKDLQWK